MTAHVIDGRLCARRLAQTLAAEVARSRSNGLRMGLATVLVGDDFGSTAYERRLSRLAGDLDVPYLPRVLPATVSQGELLDAVAELNANPGVSGILVLRPLPAHIDEATVFCAIAPGKDVEAVHPENAGLLALGIPRFVPSTAASVFHLLDTWLDGAGEDRAGFYHRSHIVVVGRSNNVGKPAIALGHARHATVESVDEWASRTMSLGEMSRGEMGRGGTGLGRHTRRADVLIVAAGRPGLIRPEHVNETAVVIDVGINPGVGADGLVHMVGDVDFEPVARRVRAITPVPGGVGPVTYVWLLRNTVLAARLQAGLPATEDESHSLQETS